jgi:hypothetical protein
MRQDNYLLARSKAGLVSTGIIRLFILAIIAGMSLAYFGV